MRTSFINYHCPFIFRTEVEFVRLMRKENISRISEADTNIRGKLLNCVLTNSASPESAQFLVTGPFLKKVDVAMCKVRLSLQGGGGTGNRMVGKRFSGRDSQQ